MDYLKLLTDQIQYLGPLFYFLVFIVAAIESFVLTGMVIPGTIIIILLGFLAAQGSLDLPLIAISTIFGAIIGDFLGYFLGATQGKLISQKLRNRFKTDYIKIGEEFFERHGDKSVFLGRFVALIRPFIPFVAGLLNMNLKKFVLWDILSAVMWGSLYLTLGYFFGASLGAIELWSKRVGLVLLIIMVFAVASYFVRKKIKDTEVNH